MGALCMLLTCFCNKPKTRYYEGPNAIYSDPIGSFAESVAPYSIDYLFDNDYNLPLSIDSVYITLPSFVNLTDGRYPIDYLRVEGQLEHQDWWFAQLGHAQIQNNAGYVYFHKNLPFNTFTNLPDDNYAVYINFHEEKALQKDVFYVVIHKQPEFSPTLATTYGFAAQSQKTTYNKSKDDMKNVVIHYTKNLPNEQIEEKAKYLLVQRLVFNEQVVQELPTITLSGSTLQETSFSTTLNLEDVWYAQVRVQSYLVLVGQAASSINATITVKDAVFNIF